MSEPAVLYSAEAGVATLTLNRPEVLNALNDDLLTGLREGLARAKADASVRAVLLTGTGRGFCAGADLAAGQPCAKARTTWRRACASVTTRSSWRCGSFRSRSSAPSTASAAGAGMSIALACDIVLAGESASFLQAFTRIGLVPDCGSTWFLPRMAGDVRARAMVMLAEKIPAADALQYGLVWKVYRRRPADGRGHGHRAAHGADADARLRPDQAGPGGQLRQRPGRAARGRGAAAGRRPWPPRTTRKASPPSWPSGRRSSRGVEAR